MSATNKGFRKNERTQTQCVAVNDALDIIRDKWTIMVLGALAHHESLRYNELEREVVGISQRMLTLTLKPLEENGLVKRTIFATVPPRVEYALTPVGRTIIKPIKGLLDWSTENRAAIAEARRAYANRTP